MKATILFFAAALLAGCSNPEPKLEINQINGILHFDMKESKGIGNLTSCVIWAEGANAVLWDVHFKWFDSKRFVYGSQGKDYNQIYPPNKQAANVPPRDKKIFVLVGFQYDSAISANAGSTLYAFIHHSDGRIENLGKQEWVKPPK